MNGKTLRDIPVLTECDQILDIRGEFPTPEVAMNHSYLQHIPDIDSDASIILIKFNLIGIYLTEAHHVHDQ
jgi:hypothetical protein